MSSERERYETTARLRHVEGAGAFHLDCFGDYLAKREKYKSHEGIAAVHFYLVQKYRWLPAQVRALNWDDLHFLLQEEMQGWTVPKEARDVYPSSDPPSRATRGRGDGHGAPAAE